MNESPENKKKSNYVELEKNGLRSFGLVLVAALFVGIGTFTAYKVVGAYLENFNELPSKRFAEAAAVWGQFGDYVGGLVNPAVGLITIVLLFISIVIQRNELETAKRTFTIQNKATKAAHVEQICFSWFKNYQDLLASISINERESATTGRHALFYWYKNSFAANQIVTVTPHPRGEYQAPLIGAKRTLALMEKKQLWETASNAIEKYEQVYREQEYQLDTLFRTLYRLLKWIDQHEEFDQEQKWFYVSMLRAQLSWIEMTFLLYNGLTRRGSQFKEIAEKYALFDNLNVESDPILESIETLSEAPFLMYKESAFDSAAARHSLGLRENRKAKREVRKPV